MARRSYDGRLLLLPQINESNVNKIIEAIYCFNEEDKILDTNQRDPIKIILKSEGGLMYDGLGLIDVIDLSTTPIHITAHGCVMSMALNILVSGHERYCSKNTTFMYHEGWYGVIDKSIQEHMEELNEAKRLNEICDSYLISKTNFTLDQLDKIKKSKGSWYFGADDALKYGVVDSIL